LIWQAMHMTSLFILENTNTLQMMKRVTQATVRCHIPLPLINHQTAPKSWVYEDAVIVLNNINRNNIKHCCCVADVIQI